MPAAALLPRRHHLECLFSIYFFFQFSLLVFIFMFLPVFILFSKFIFFLSFDTYRFQIQSFKVLVQIYLFVQKFHFVNVQICKLIVLVKQKCTIHALFHNYAVTLHRRSPSPGLILHQILAHG